MIRMDMGKGCVMNECMAEEWHPERRQGSHVVLLLLLRLMRWQMRLLWAQVLQLLLLRMEPLAPGQLPGCRVPPLLLTLSVQLAVPRNQR
jgi:hypothetical protein